MGPDVNIFWRLSQRFQPFTHLSPEYTTPSQHRQKKWCFYILLQILTYRYSKVGYKRVEIPFFNQINAKIK